MSATSIPSSRRVTRMGPLDSSKWRRPTDSTKERMVEESFGSSPAPGPAAHGAISRFVTQQPGVVISGVYLLSSAIGMLDSWWYYRRFGINVFLYSDLADFLLASFRSPTA